MDDPVRVDQELTLELRPLSFLVGVVGFVFGIPVELRYRDPALRIDEPLPPKADAPVAAAPMPMPEAAPMPEKRLSPLEKLRLERQQAKAARAAQAAGEPK